MAEEFRQTKYLQLFDLLKTKRLKPVALSVDNKPVVPQEAEVIRFNFIKDGTNYGPAWLFIDDKKYLNLYYDDEKFDSYDINTSGTPFSNSWFALLEELKQWAVSNKCKGWNPKNQDELAYDMQQRKYLKNKNVFESYAAINKKTSVNNAVPTVKIVIEHNRNLEETDRRYHNVSRIFIENQNGERFLVNTKRPGLAKVYARHIAEGGTPYDERGRHISSLIEEYTKMRGFVRATREGQFTESAQKLLSEAFTYTNSLRETLHKIAGHRGYNAYFDAWTPVLNEEMNEEHHINELFVRETLDPRIESVLPILNRLNKKITQMKEVHELDNWANQIIQEKLKVSEEIKSDTAANYSLNATSRKPGYYLERVGQAGPIAGPFATPQERRKAFDNLINQSNVIKTYYDAAGNKEFKEGISAQQKKVGQLGPTEKARTISPVLGKPPKQHPFKGKLVGASESKNKSLPKK